MPKLAISLDITASPLAILYGTTAIYIVDGKLPNLITDFSRDFYYNDSFDTFSNTVTHSASSNATMVDSDGLLKWRPHNLLTYSEQFDNAAWVKSNVTVTANAAAAPDGTVTADRIVGTGVWLIYQTPGNLANHTISVWAKSNTGSNQTFRFITNSSQTSGNLTATTEWQLFEFEQTSAGSSWGWGLTRDISNGDVDLLIWGAHVYRSDLGGMVNNPDRGDSYVPTTTSAVYLPRRGHHVYNGDSWVNKGLLHESEARTNLAFYSNDLDSISPANIATVTQTATGPDGNLSLFEIVENTSTSVHYLSALVTVTASVDNCFSCIISDAGDGRYIYFRTNNDGANQWINIDPSTGTITEVGSGVSQSGIIDLGGGFYRPWFVCQSADGSSGYIIALGTSATPGATLPSYTGDGTSKINAGFVQVEQGSTPSSYIPTSGATVTRSAETLTVPAANLPWPSPVVIGEELVTNGGFDTDSDWTLDAGVTISGGTLNNTTDTAVFATQAGVGSSGKIYQVSYDVTARTSGSVSVGVGSVSGEARSAVGSYVDYIVATSSDGAFVTSRFGSAFVGSIDNISVKEINPLSVSIQMQGEMTYADTSSLEVVPYRWYGSGTEYLGAYLYTTGAETGEFNFFHVASGTSASVRTPIDKYAPGVNVPFSIAARHGSTFVNGAADGTALVASTTPVALPNLSATNLELGYVYMGTIKLFRIWANDLTDAGIAEASAPSTVPSLSLTFDGQSTSFTDTGMTV